MTPDEAAARLETILLAENAALERHDPAAATALLAPKLVAARALTAEGLPRETGERLAALAAENQRLLERAIAVQGQIVELVVRAAQSAPTVVRYGAAGRALPPDGALALALARQA